MSNEVQQFDLLQKSALPQITNDLINTVEGDRVLAQNAANTATTQASIATTQAGIATTKATEAGNSASAALAAYEKLPNAERALSDLLAHLLGRIETLEQELAESKYNTMEINTLSVVDNIRLKGADLILFGTEAPAVTPDFIGQFFVNTTAGITYQAKGIVNSGDWKQTSN